MKESFQWSLLNMIIKNMEISVKKLLFFKQSPELNLLNSVKLVAIVMTGFVWVMAENLKSHSIFISFIFQAFV